jgi:hypothetical protein
MSVVSIVTEGDRAARGKKIFMDDVGELLLVSMVL